MMSEDYRIVRVMNDVTLRLRIVLIRTWKSGKYVKENRSEIENQTLYEVLEFVHKKGRNKNKNDRRKRNNEQNREASDHPNRKPVEVREINNLSKHKQQFEDVRVKDLLAVDTYELEYSEKMNVQDTTILCYILLNSLLGIQLPGKVKEAIIKIKDIRNEASHANVEHDKKWFKDCMECIRDCMDVLSEEYTLEPFVPSLLPSLEDLKEKVDQNYEPNALFINLQYQYGTGNDVNSLEEFITENRTSSAIKSCVVALSGISGSGKSTTLSHLAYQFSKTDVFKLVVLVNEKKIKGNKDPVDLFFSGLKKLAPDQFVDQEDELKKMLKLYMRDILIILDIDIEDPKELTHCISEGNWVITTSTDFESCDLDNLHVLKIKPLDENQVKDFLAKLNQDRKEHKNIIRKYDDCTCKKYLNTPELVIIFSSLKGDESITSEISLIQCLFDKKMGSLKGKEKMVIKGLGQQACKAVSMKTDCISYKFNCEEAIIQQFLVTEEKQLERKVTCRKFQHTLLRDILCAQFYVENPAAAFKMCRWAPYLYKKAFKLACYFAISTNRFKQFKDHINEFLSCLFKSSKKVIISVEGKDIEVFQSWGFVFHIDEACQNKEARRTIIMIIAKLIHNYDRWNLNCRDLKVENIQIFCDIIKSMEVKQEKVVTLELVLHCDVLSFNVANRLWNALRNIKIPFKLCVMIDMHREFLHKECLGIRIEESLDFCQSINESCKSVNLSVVEYKGPMLLSKTLDPLGSEGPLRGLVSLEVHVFDVFSLKRLLSCKELKSLRTLDITFKMSNPQESVETLCHSFSEQKDKLRFSLSIVSYNGIQKLLNKISDIECLTSLGILDVTVEDLIGNDRIDVKDFKTLKTLELRAKVDDMDKGVPLDKIKGTKLDSSNRGVPRDRSAEDASRMEQDDLDKVVIMDETMDVTGPLNQEEDNRKRRRDLSETMNSYSSGQQVTSPSRASIFSNVLLPERLYCLILIGFRISDTSFLNGLDNKRVIISPGRVKVSDIPALLGESLESQVKRMKLEKDDSIIKKKKRYPKEEREKRRRWPQPRKKEIIITQEDDVDEDWSHFVKVEFHHVVRVLQRYQGSMFIYKSEKVTFRKDVCEDIRICLPVELLKDDTIIKHFENPSGEGEDFEFMRNIYRTLSLVQYITLEETSLSREGVHRFATKLIETKKRMTEGGEVDPFHLSIATCKRIRKEDIEGSRLHKFVVDSKDLDKFSFLCKKDSSHFRKTVDGKIWINRCQLSQ